MKVQDTHRGTIRREIDAVGDDSRLVQLDERGQFRHGRLEFLKLGFLNLGRIEIGDELIHDGLPFRVGLNIRGRGLPGSIFLRIQALSRPAGDGETVRNGVEKSARNTRHRILYVYITGGD